MPLDFQPIQAMESRLFEKKNLPSGRLPDIAPEFNQIPVKDNLRIEEVKETLSQRREKQTSETLDSYFEKFIQGVMEKQTNIKSLNE